tara:strand:- start:212 stop:622 length:411 start_codon:yes stop_codon:yes gene_type:complete
MLKREPSNLSKNQMINIILKPLESKHYSMKNKNKNKIEIEMTVFHNFHLQCATCGGKYYNDKYAPLIIKLSDIDKEKLYKIWKLNAERNEGKGYIDLKNLGFNRMYCKQEIIDSNGNKHICGGTFIQLIDTSPNSK